MTRPRLLALALLTVLAALLWYLEPGRWLSLEALHAHVAQWQAYARSHRALAATGYFVAYVMMAAVSLPGAAILTLAGGALFGVLWGTVLVSFASTLGATLACLFSRFLLRDFVERRFPSQAARVNEGIAREGNYYLFGLRLVPVFPFFVINLVMGLTRLPIRSFYWVSQLGMLPATAIYVNAGTQLASVQSLGDVLSPAVAGSFALLGLFPLIARRLMQALSRRAAGPAPPDAPTAP